jgi:broad-specificity NMP kinase
MLMDQRAGRNRRYGDRAPRSEKSSTSLWKLTPGHGGYGLLVAVVLITGMSGTGKSAALAELARRGHRVVDTDYGDWAEDGPSFDGREREKVWREDRIDALLRDHKDGVLFVSGCVPNQAKFYSRFDAVVLLSAPVEVILERVAVRDTNVYGKTDAERGLIVEDLTSVEPLLRAGATAEIDTRLSLGEVVDALERIAAASAPNG